jgi:hypothetical protein
MVTVCAIRSKPHLLRFSSGVLHQTNNATAIKKKAKYKKVPRVRIASPNASPSINAAVIRRFAMASVIPSSKHHIGTDMVAQSGQ